MKHIRSIILGMLVLSVAGYQAKAQLLDDLFEEEDFKSSEIEKMQKETAAKKEMMLKKEQASSSSASAPASPVASTPAPVPAVVQASPSQPSLGASAPAASVSSPVPAVSNAPVPAQKSFSLSTGPQAIQKMPQIGMGKPESMPNLGVNARRKNEENLSLFEMRARKKGSSSTNVLKFDIAGIQLKMTPAEVEDAAKNASFDVKFKDWKLPVLNEWKYHRQCLDKMSFSYQSKKDCIQKTAQRNNQEYISRLVFENKERKETISVEFTSMYTQNQAYRVSYTNKGDHSLGSTEEARYLKTKRRMEFLETLIKKYGQPDDELALLWGIAGRDAVLQAGISPTFLDVYLIMEDLSLEENDLDMISEEEVKTDPFNKFSF